MSLTLTRVGHRYGNDRFVLREVDLKVEAGSVAALMGPSGSGKSTLLAIAGLLLRPVEGRVHFGGRTVGPQSRGEVAWIFQSSNLFPRRTALENAMMGALSRGVSVETARRCALSALDSVRIGHLADAPVRFISGGEGQRVGVARALGSQAPYLFADEPTGQLDADTTRVVLEGIRRRRQLGAVTLIATHDPLVAASCDFTYVVTDGTLRDMRNVATLDAGTACPVGHGQ